MLLLHVHCTSLLGIPAVGWVQGALHAAQAKVRLAAAATHVCKLACSLQLRMGQTGICGCRPLRRLPGIAAISNKKGHPCSGACHSPHLVW